jgi:lipopolysaccharide/colanic/teichoic acid biosynthesis glycosyltransferase
VTGTHVLPRGSGLRRLSRRCFDVLTILAAAPIVVPLIAVIALAIRIDSPGPIFIRHRRVGLAGRRFQLVKLRTMVRNAEELKEQYRDLNVLPWPDFKIPDDPRVTRVGRFLRKASLDELPQFWNVIVGDLTLVGPRPCSVDVSHYELWQTERLEVQPGLFGRWQAEGRGRSTFSGRCRTDIRQIRNRSLRSDVGLTLKTLAAVVSGEGAT